VEEGSDQYLKSVMPKSRLVLVEPGMLGEPGQPMVAAEPGTVHIGIGYREDNGAAIAVS
jgi:hypothetical protein